MTFAQWGSRGPAIGPDTPLPRGGHSPLQKRLEVLLGLKLLVPERGWEAQRPAPHLTARTHLHVHMQCAGVSAGSPGLGARKEDKQRFNRQLNITF